MIRKTLLLGPLRSQSGKGKIGCFFSLLILGAIAFGLYKFVPPYVSYYQLKDAAGEIATLSAVGFLPRTTGTSGRSEGTVPEIQEAVFVKAKELEIPLEKEKIKVRREGQVVFISVSYVVPIDLLMNVYEYKFDFTAHN
jgi:hypothetical protein